MKQVIVMRTDLNMRKGKMVAQGGHAVLGVAMGYAARYEGMVGYTHLGNRTNQVIFDFPDTMIQWLNMSFTKICVKADSEEKLMSAYNQAQINEIPCCLITDSGKTEFHGVPTVTCCAIGPDTDEHIDEITGQKDENGKYIYPLL